MNDVFYYQNLSESSKEIDNIDLNLLSVASMNDLTVANATTPIIGTYSLATCFGVILSDDTNYVLCHISNDFKLIKKACSYLNNNGAIKVTIIPGTYTTKAKIKEFTNYLTNRDNFLLYDFEIVIKKMQEYNIKDGIEFAFDTRTKTFLLPNYDEYINKTKKRGR